MLKQWTERETEAWAERQMDKLDKRYMAGELTQEEYDNEVAGIGEKVQRLLEC
jgi:uncharacterized membrane protein